MKRTLSIILCGGSCGGVTEWAMNFRPCPVIKRNGTRAVEIRTFSSNLVLSLLRLKVFCVLFCSLNRDDQVK